MSAANWGISRAPWAFTMETMKTISALLVLALGLIAACDQDPKAIGYGIRVQDCSGPCDLSRPLGIGGVVYGYADSPSSGPGWQYLVSTNDRVLQVVDEGFEWKVVGVEPGTADSILIANGQTVDRVTFTVGEVTSLELASEQAVLGPFLDPDFDAVYRVPSGRFGLQLQTMVGDEPSLGFHLYDVSIDGELYFCVPGYCTGPGLRRRQHDPARAGCTGAADRLRQRASGSQLRLPPDRAVAQNELTPDRLTTAVAARVPSARSPGWRARASPPAGR